MSADAEALSPRKNMPTARWGASFIVFCLSTILILDPKIAVRDRAAEVGRCQFVGNLHPWKVQRSASGKSLSPSTGG
jgi:hypothetical protein